MFYLPVTGDDGGWSVEGIRVRVLQLSGGSHEGGDGDERSHHCGQAPVRGPGPAEGGPQGPPRVPVHAASCQHEDAGKNGHGERHCWCID